jgi:hypothetical protein
MSTKLFLIQIYHLKSISLVWGAAFIVCRKLKDTDLKANFAFKFFKIYCIFRI